MSLADELNKIKPFVETEEGKVKLLDRQTDEPSDFPGHGYLDGHPEGADRGGYVPFWFNGNESAFYDSMEGEWV